MSILPTIYKNRPLLT